MSKEEPESYLCRCCHSEGAFTSLFSYCLVDTEEILYMNVLQECFDIELAPVMQSMQHKLCSVCDSCAQRLLDAVHFKRQVHKYEMRFRDIYSSCIETQIINVKQEIEDVKDVLALSYGTKELLSQQAPMPLPYAIREARAQPTPMLLIEPLQKSQQPEVKPIKSDDDDDDGFNDPDDDSDFKPTDDEKDVKKERNDSEQDEKKDKRMKKEKPEERILIKLQKGIHFEVIEEKYHCLLCPYVTASKDFKGSIKYHVESHHVPTYKCSICADVFFRKVQLSTHKIEKHRIDERFKCNACDSSFHRKRQLLRHMNCFHKLGEPYPCKECDHVTYSQPEYKAHRVVHLKDKNYKCKYCTKAFKRSGTLLYHERSHTGDKRKKCSECGAAFVQRASLKYHMLKHHPGVPF